MGLGMYLYKAKKASERQKYALTGLLENDAEIDESFEDVAFFDKSIEDVLLKDFINLCDEVSMKDLYVDMKKLKDDFNIPEDAYECGFGFDAKGPTYTYSFRNQDNSYHTDISIPQEEFEKNYVFEKDAVYLICHMREIDHWQEEYPLRQIILEDIKQKYPNAEEEMNREKEQKERDAAQDNSSCYYDLPVAVKNCGYYRLDEKTLKRINDYNEEHGYGSGDYSCDVDEVILYHEWY